MRFLLDANIPYSSKEIFAPHHNAFHVRDLGLEKGTDARIFDEAKKKNLILVTRDLDFANILSYPPGKHSGIVVIRVPFSFIAKDINKVLSRFLSNVSSKEIKGTTTIVEPTRFRIRR